MLLFIFLRHLHFCLEMRLQSDLDLFGDFSGFRGKEIGNEKLIAILDLQQIGYKNVDARGLITGFQFLQVSDPSYYCFANDISFYIRNYNLAIDT